MTFHLRYLVVSLGVNISHEYLDTIFNDLGFPSGSDGKSVCLQCGRPGFDSWIGKIPWRRKWQSTPALLPGKSHGQRSLVGYSPWGCKSRTRLSDFTFTLDKASKDEAHTLM